jgi:hypothetical protein
MRATNHLSFLGFLAHAPRLAGNRLPEMRSFTWTARGI